MDKLDKILNTVESQEINTIVTSVLAKSEFDVRQEISELLPYTRKVSINDIVPEEYQQKLMQIDFTMTQCYWLIGDIANELVNSVNRARAKELSRIINRKDIFEAVGFFCHRAGRSVRYYYECAWYFPVEVRQKYDVPFNIYSEARWVKDWELLLQIAQDNPMWSAEHVRSEYHRVSGEERSTRKPREPKEVEIEEKDETALPEEEEVVVGAQSKYKHMLLSKLEHTSDDLREVIDRIPLPNEIRIRIRDVLLEIQDIEMEIRREM